MPFLNETTGTISLDGGIRFTAHMPRKALLKMLLALSGNAPDAEDAGVLLIPACTACGGKLAPVCTLQNHVLTEITLTVVSVGQRLQLTAEQQRAFLLSCIGVKDPCPDTYRPCEFNCAFGSMLLHCDPRLGSASLRIVYE